MSLQEKALRALVENNIAALEGAADDITLGAYGKYMPGAQERMKESNWASNTGRALTYMLPLPNKLKALTKLDKLENATKLKNLPAQVGTPLRKLLAMIGRSKGVTGVAAKTAAGTAKAAGNAVLRGEAQHAAREGVKSIPGGTNPEDSPSSAKERMAMEAGFGVGAKALGQVAKKLAPLIYTHPGLVNKDKLNESTMNAKDMLRQRLFGTLQGKFRSHANKLEDEVNVVKDKIIPEASRREQVLARRAQQRLSQLSGKPEPKPKGMTTLDTLSQHGKASAKKMHGSEESERQSMKDAFRFTGKQMAPDKHGLTNINEVDRVAREVNTQIKNTFSGAEKGKAYGQLDGSLSAKKDRLTKLKEGVDQMEYEGIDRFGHNNKVGRVSDIDKYENARRTYRTGVDLNDSIDSHLRATHGKDPYVANGMLRNAANATIGSAPIRTFLGVLLDSVARGRPAAGQLAELRSRNNGEPPPVEGAPGGDDLMELPPPPAPTEEEAPQIDASEARAASAKKFGLADPKILAALDDPSNPEKIKAGAATHKRQNPKLYKKFDELDAEDDNLLTKLPPPR